jgi:hypothetical protein
VGTQANNNTAIFLGIESTSPDIYAVSISATTNVSSGYAINQLAIVDTLGGATPGPDSLLVFALGFIGGACRLRRPIKRTVRNPPCEP